MRNLIIQIFFILLITSCSKPLMVSHIMRPDIKFVNPKDRGYGKPKHSHINYFICFDPKCRKKVAWMKKTHTGKIKYKPVKKKNDNKKVDKSTSPANKI